jgi:hypothetical protein
MSLQYASAQQQPSTPAATPSTSAGGLKFFIKTASNNTNTTTTAGGGSSNATKKITINVHVQQGPNGKPATLPITAIVPQNTKLSDLQLCGSVGNEQPMCQPLASSAPGGGGKSTLDLTKQSPSTGGATAGSSPSGGAASSPVPGIAPDSYHGSTITIGHGIFTNAIFSSPSPSLSPSPSSSQPFVMTADNNKAFYYIPVQSNLLGGQGSLIGSVNVPINVDVTAIVPINVAIQNAQICAQIGGGSCTQAIFNPTQSTFAPTTIDLSQPTPTITPTTTATPTMSTTTTQPTTTTPTPPTSTTTPTQNVPTSPTQNGAPPTANAPTSPTQNVPATTPPPSPPSSPSTGSSSSGGSSSPSGGGSGGSSGGGK